MSFTQLIKEIKGDFVSRNPLLGFLRNYFLNPSFRVLLNHRIGKYFYRSENKVLRLVASRLKYKLISKRGCDISYNAVIGKRVRFPHAIGIVIGEGVIIEDNVTIFQHVTIGSHGKRGEIMKYPVLNQGAKIYAGAKIIGGVVIGENAVVGANTVVNIDVPSNQTAVGIPCRILYRTI